MHMLFRLFSRHISRTQSFQHYRHIVFHALVALKLSVSLISRLVACSARIVVDRQTDRQTLEDVHRTLTPRSTAVIRSHTIVTRARCWSLDLNPGSGTRISAKQQSHTEEYGVVHGGSNHIRKNTAYYTRSE